MRIWWHSIQISVSHLCPILAKIGEFFFSLSKHRREKNSNTETGADSSEGTESVFKVTG